MAVIGYSLLFIKRLFSSKKGQNPKAVRRWGAAPFPLWKEDKDRKRCLLSANSYGIREREGDHPPGVGWWKVESTM